MPEENQELTAEAMEAERPEWLDSRYQSVEDQARAYSEAQRLVTTATQRASAAENSAAELAQRLEALEQQARQPQQGYDPTQDPLILAAARAYEEGDYVQAEVLRDRRMAQFFHAYSQQQQQQQPQGAPQDNGTSMMLAEQAIERALGDDLHLLRDGVEQVFAENPHWFRDPRIDPAGAAADYIRVAKSVKAERLAEQSARLDTQHSQAVREKRLAQTATGGGRGEQSAQSARDALKEAMGKLPRADSLIA